MSTTNDEVALGQDEAQFRETVAAVRGGKRHDETVQVNENVSIRLVQDSDTTFTMTILVDDITEYVDDDDSQPPTVARRLFPRLVGDIHAALRAMFRIPVADEFDFRRISEDEEEETEGAAKYTRRVTVQGESPEKLLRA